MGLSIFDVLREEKLLREAEEDSQDNSSEETSPPETPAESGGDDDFDIDTKLDDGGEEGRDDAGSEAGDDGLGAPVGSEDSGDTSSPSGSTSSDSGELDSGNEELNDDNTDVFATLTAEEQQLKIKELKKLYQDLYISCDDILDRINNMDNNEETVYAISKLSASLYSLKKYISSYIITIFPKMSYVENDIAFNRFLMILNSIKEILEKYNIKIIKDENNK